MGRARAEAPARAGDGAVHVVLRHRHGRLLRHLPTGAHMCVLLSLRAVSADVEGDETTIIYTCNILA